MTDTQQPAVPFFKKGKSRPTNQRKRDASPPSARAGPSRSVPEAPAKSEVVLPPRKAGPNLLSAGTKRLKSQREDDDFSEEDTRDGPDVKWTAKGSHQAAAQEILAGDEAEALDERRNKKTKLNGDDDEDDAGPDDGLYHGQNAYKTHIKKNKEIPKAMRVGPQRNASSTIRQVTIVDYQPDVCKDYKGVSASKDYLCFKLLTFANQRLVTAVSGTLVSSYTTEAPVSSPACFAVLALSIP